MALTTCRECGEQVSDTAKICPHCGAPHPYKEEWKGWGYEWKSESTFLGYPLVHIAFGKNEKGRLRVAKGVIAIGQFAIGAVTIAQFGIGFLFGFGQVILGMTAIAQLAITILFGLGQFSVGYIAIGQFAIGYYVLAQAGFGEHIWTQKVKDPEAIRYFKNLLQQLKEVF
jgi:ribosomal protein L37E